MHRTPFAEGISDIETDAAADQAQHPSESPSEQDIKRARFCLNTYPGCKAARMKQKGFWHQAVRASDGKLSLGARHTRACWASAPTNPSPMRKSQQSTV